ncbi:nuclear transport factor 2 family protein [Actinokineospora iranica]|uniref:SnoaL-like domain-containing protein n=1 Tax=Actinokineospora iranica TaxID=1271860 RepID=A0A1G6QGH3_9PSEU|nr:nuclear transport factor 2 family protein [Actinokineospora iranica]SDC90755.1 SnoaL-like domain-containing protein [Actinokineospora iranica]
MASRLTRRTALVTGAVTAASAAATGIAAADTESGPRADPVAVTIDMAVLFDRRQWDELRAVFTETVWVDYTGLVGGEPGAVLAADLVDGWRRGLGHLSATQHLLGNQRVRIRGAEALVTAEFQATHRVGPLAGGVLYTLGGRYDYRLALVGRGWRISAVTMTPVWESGDRTVIGLPVSPQ